MENLIAKDLKFRSESGFVFNPPVGLGLNLHSSWFFINFGELMGCVRTFYKIIF